MSAEENSKKTPAFQFYPADWRKDPGVQSLSFEDRGIWHEIICLMHESPRRGVLLMPNGAPMMTVSLARILGTSTPKLIKSLARIEKSGVSDREAATGALMNRRMVRDEVKRKEISEERKRVGAIGNAQKAAQTTRKSDAHAHANDSQNSTQPAAQPERSSSSSSSSSSPSGKENTNPSLVLPLSQKPKQTPLRPKKQETEPPVVLDVTEEMRQWAHDNGFTDAVVEKQTPAMLDYFRANGKKRLDWVATWRNWLRNSHKYNGNGNGVSHGRRESEAEARDRRTQEAAHRLRERVVNQAGGGGSSGTDGEDAGDVPGATYSTLPFAD